MVFVALAALLAPVAAHAAPCEAPPHREFDLRLGE